MKKGFSLIEIVQTLVLIGIIAGISVSLFKRVDNDIKLLEATEKQLKIAIEEVHKRTCADVSPICVSSSGGLCDTSNNFKECEQAGEICAYLNESSSGTSEYNHASGYCEYKANATPCLAGFNTELRGGKNLCYKEPRCSDGTYVKIRSSELCKDNIPDLDARRQYTGNVDELCYQLHSIINHKNQDGVGGVSDLNNTCLKTKGTCLSNGACGAVNEEANMILPNGVRIYNLPCMHPNTTAKAADCPEKGVIYIRYDRMDDLKMVDMNKVARYTIDADGNLGARQFWDDNDTPETTDDTWGNGFCFDATKHWDSVSNTCVSPP